MSSKSPVRSCDDIDETALSYSEIKALCAGNPLIGEKMQLDNEVARLRMLKSEHNTQHYRLEDNILKTFPQQIKSIAERIEGVEKDMASYAEHKKAVGTVQAGLDGQAAQTAGAKFAGMVINGVTYAEKEPAGKALLELCKDITAKEDKQIGEYMDFKMSIAFDSFSKQFRLFLRGNMTYQLDLGTDAFGNITRINNALDDLSKKLDGLKSQLEDKESQMEAAKLELTKPFPYETELAEKEARLSLLNTELNIDGNGGFDVINDADNRDENGETQPPQNDERDSEDDYDYEDESYEPLQRTGTYGKSAPTFMDNIKNLGARNQDKPPPSVKKPGIEI